MYDLVVDGGMWVVGDVRMVGGGWWKKSVGVVCGGVLDWGGLGIWGLGIWV